MRKLNSFQISATQGVVGRLPKPFDVREHVRGEALVCETIVSVNNTSGGSITLTNAQALDLMRKVFGTWNLMFGSAQPETIDDAKSFDEMRKLCWALIGRDMQFNGKELRNYANTDSDAVVIANGGTVAVRMAFIRPFTYERGGARMTEWCPYASQLKDMALSFVRGGALSTAGLAQSGAADCTVYLMEVDSESADGYAPVARSYQNNDAGLNHSGPPGGGALLCLYEDTAVGASTSLNLFSLERKGDVPLHDQVEGAQVVRDSYLKRDQSTANLNDLATVLFELPEAVDINRLPTSSEFRLKQSAQNLSPMQSRWIYIPTVTEQYGLGVAAPNVAGRGQGAKAVKLVNSAAVRGENVPQHIASVLSLAAVDPTAPKADMLDGIIAKPNGQHVVHLSPIQTAALSGATGEAGAKVVAQTSKERAKSIPGYTSPQRGAAPAGARVVAEKTSPGIIGSIRGFLGI
jgi:hypothetical protein